MKRSRSLAPLAVVLLLAQLQTPFSPADDHPGGETAQPAQDLSPLPAPASPEELENLKARVPQLRDAASERRLQALGAAAILAQAGDCAAEHTVADCLSDQIAQNQARMGLVSDDEGQALAQQNQSLSAQLEAPAALAQSALDLDHTSSGLQEMLSAQDFSYKAHLERIWQVFKGSWRFLVTKDPLIALSIGTAGSLAAIPFNDPIASHYANPANRPSNLLVQTGAQLGYAYLVLVPWVVIAALKKDNALMDTADVMLGGLALDVTLNTALKYAINAKRPPGAGLTDPGFPSEHASVSFTIATVIEQQLGWKWGAPAYAIASFVGYSRIGGGYHYLGQVLFGAGLGVASGLAASDAARKGKASWVAKVMSGEVNVRGREMRYDWAPSIGPDEKGANLQLSW